MWLFTRDSKRPRSEDVPVLPQVYKCSVPFSHKPPGMCHFKAVTDILSGVLGLICEVELLVKGPVLSHPPIHPSVLSGPVPHASRVLSVGDPVSVSTPVLTL